MVRKLLVREAPIRIRTLERTFVKSFKVTVIVLNFNGKHFLQQCLDSVSKQSYGRVDLMVVDNASEDNSVEFVRDNFPHTYVVRNSTNLGFAEGNNVGIRLALARGADFVLLLNNDTVLDPAAIEAMISLAASEPSAGIVGSLVRDLEDRQMNVELGLDCDIIGFPLNMIDRQIQKDVTSPFYVSGCAMMVKREVFQRIGLLDSSYFMFAEDLDFCWRARLAGYAVYATRSSIVYHKSGGTTPGGALRGRTHQTTQRRMYLSRRNTLKTLLKNYGFQSLLFTLPLSVLFELVTAATALALRQPKISKACVEALTWNLKNMPDTVQARIQVQAMRRISDRDVLARLSKKSSLVRSYLMIDDIELASK